MEDMLLTLFHVALKRHQECFQMKVSGKLRDFKVPTSIKSAIFLLD